MSGKLPRLRALRPRGQQKSEGVGHGGHGTDVVGGKLSEEKAEMKMMAESEVAIERGSADGSYEFDRSEHGAGHGIDDDEDEDEDDDDDDDDDDGDDDGDGNADDAEADADADNDADADADADADGGDGDCEDANGEGDGDGDGDGDGVGDGDGDGDGDADGDDADGDGGEDGGGDGEGEDNDDEVDVEEDENEEGDEDEGSSSVKTDTTEIKLSETVHSYECKACKPPKILNNVKTYLDHLKKEHKRKDTHGDDMDGNRCSMCSYVALSLRDMENHQRVHHLKRRFFRCAKCSYVTHVRARYTKHVKYHSMPMIKCDSCDFRTPYKWNLDRHTRNHGGGGAFQCRVCNFTADIRQSLTVHETNHHEPPLGQANRKSNTPFERKPRNSPKRYNQVGASDFRESISLAETTSISPADLYISSNVDQVMTAIEEKKNAIASAECIALKCEEKGCQFITAWDSEMQRHLAECHAPGMSSGKSRKPLPMLIPLSPVNSNKSSNSSSNGSTTTLLKVPRVRVRPELAQIARDTEIAKLYGTKEVISLKKDTVSTAADLFEKKNASFFDKLKEKLTSSTAINNGMQEMAMSTVNDLKCWCTFKASNLEELARHKRTHHTALSVSVGTSSGASGRPEKVANCGSEFRVASYRGEYTFPSQIDWDLNVGGLNSSTSSVEGASTHPSGRRVFKCPHCPFWASTASRFHVHIVGHLNRKPFECSLCAYRSNWRWDITKHIKLKAAKDPVHMTARVLMTDETGRRNYSKYNKYLAQVEQQSWDDQTGEERNLEEIRSEEPPAKLLIMSSNKERMQSPGLSSSSVSVLSSPSRHHEASSLNLPLRPPPPLKAAAARGRGQSLLKNKPLVQAVPTSGSSVSNSIDESKRILWKCKRCNYRDSNKATVLLHVKSHYESVWQTVNESRNEFACGECPFTATDAASLSVHKMHHRPNLEAIFKCYLCPYYVSTKAELLDHARLHGEELAVVHQQSMDYHQSSMSKVKLPRIPSENGSTDGKDERTVEQVIHITSANDTGSPGSSQEQKSMGSGSSSSVAPPPPLLLDTRALAEPPLVWVSRPDGTLSKMLKCRHCPYVSSRRAEVIDHETMHIDSPNHQGSVIACTDCSFTCARREAMIAHSEMHAGSLGTVHCLVDETRADSQQLNDLTALLGLNHPPTLGSEPDLRDSRLVHCCGKCPARFLCEKELRIHLRYHSTELAYSCQWCSYAARQPAHLLAHQKAHSTEYQERTKYLLSLYGHSQRYSPPTTACVETANDRDRDESGNPGIAWIVVEMAETAVTRSFNGSLLSSNSMQKIPAGSQVFTCAKCPARYFKLDALEYHMTLHGSNNRFKCSECDYSSKTAQNLVKHQVVHRRHNETKEPILPPHHQQKLQHQHQHLQHQHQHQHQQQHQQPQHQQQPQQQQLPPPPPPPPPPPDPQFGVFMRGNPNFVYPGYLRNGRLKEKRYKCHKCPSAFEKREQYRVHLTLHGAKQRYRCGTCDYSVKYYANYIQHLKKHQANAEAQASRRQFEEETINVDNAECVPDNGTPAQMAALTSPLSSSSSSSPSSTSSSSSSLSISRSSKTLKSSAMVNFGGASTVTSSAALPNSIASSAISNGPISPTSGSLNTASSSLQASNQDKQSLMVMRKKGILSASAEPEIEVIRCQSCPFSSADKETMDAHKRRHGIERMTPPCPHCDYIPRKDENVGEHVRLHFTRLYKPESYLIIELLTLTMKRLLPNGKEEKPKQTAELLFKECPDGRFFPLADAKSLTLGTSNNVNNFREKVIVDPNTGEAKHHLAV